MKFLLKLLLERSSKMTTKSQVIENQPKKFHKLPRKNLYDSFLRLLRAGVKGLQWSVIEKERVNRC